MERSERRAAIRLPRVLVILLLVASSALGLIACTEKHEVSMSSSVTVLEQTSGTVLDAAAPLNPIELLALFACVCIMILALLIARRPRLSDVTVHREAPPSFRAAIARRLPSLTLSQLSVART